MRFSESLEQQFEELLVRHPDRRSALIPSLRVIQREHGYVSDDALREVTSRLGVNEVDAENIVGYFNIRRQKPSSRHVLDVCVNLRCRRRGGEALLEHCKKTLEIEAGQVTSDRLFYLREVVCLGACDTGPSMRVDQQHYEQVTPLRFDAILERLRKIGDDWR